MYIEQNYIANSTGSASIVILILLSGRFTDAHEAAKK